MELRDIIKDLQGRIDYAKAEGYDMDGASFGYEEGAVVSFNTLQRLIDVIDIDRPRLVPPMAYDKLELVHFDALAQYGHDDESKRFFLPRFSKMWVVVDKMNREFKDGQLHVAIEKMVRANQPGQ